MYNMYNKNYQYFLYICFGKAVKVWRKFGSRTGGSVGRRLAEKRSGEENIYISSFLSPIPFLFPLFVPINIFYSTAVSSFTPSLYIVLIKCLTSKTKKITSLAEDEVQGWGSNPRLVERGNGETKIRQLHILTLIKSSRDQGYLQLKLLLIRDDALRSVQAAVVVTLRCRKPDLAVYTISPRGTGG